MPPARASRELLDNALAVPVRTLAGNALPQRFRSRVRAFLEGIVVYSGMSLAGAVLLASNERCPVQAFAIGRRVRTVQWHPELTLAVIRGYIEGRKEILGHDKKLLLGDRK